MAGNFNFARKPFSNERLPRLVFTLATLLVLLTTLVHGVVLTRSLMREREALDDQVAELRRRLSEAETEIASAQGTLSQERNAVRAERVRFLTRLYRQKSFSWTGLFNELEAIIPRPVRITSISPTEEEGKITVSMDLVSKELSDLLDMVRVLEGSRLFATVYPTEEYELDDPAETGIGARLVLRYVETAARDGAEEDSLEERTPSAAETPGDTTGDEGSPEEATEGMGDSGEEATDAEGRGREPSVPEPPFEEEIDDAEAIEEPALPPPRKPPGDVPGRSW